MRMTSRELNAVSRLESRATRTGAAKLTRREAEVWCCVHVNEDWYRLPLMLMARGYGGDCAHFIEVDAMSVYELHESGCFVEFPEWWDRLELWRKAGDRG